jgi:DNA-binding NtrC family response regulator
MRATDPLSDREARRIQGGESPSPVAAELIGRDPGMQDVHSMIDRVSRTNATVLILGEPGSGKELVARTIHARSLRAERPFTVVDCAAILPGLLESELFGHERGSFTSALRKQIGKFEDADGGTVFLDEIAELPLDLQVRLLRLLQTRQLTRVGGTAPITVDVRFIAATSSRLGEMVRAKTFRGDLFYRINAVSIRVPPLRERAGDIPLLVQRIIASISQRDGIPSRRLSGEALGRLREYAWPGNVRELENVLERALIVAEGAEITARELAFSGEAPVDDHRSPGRLRSLREIEIGHIRDILTATKGNESEAARILGIHRDTLYRKLRRYGIVGPPQDPTRRVS